MKAAEWTKERREALLAQGAGIAFETVLSTEEKIDFLARAKAAGYFVRVFFIATSDPRINADAHAVVHMAIDLIGMKEYTPWAQS